MSTDGGERVDERASNESINNADILADRLCETIASIAPDINHVRLVEALVIVAARRVGPLEAFGSLRAILNSD